MPGLCAAPVFPSVHGLSPHLSIIYGIVCWPAPRCPRHGQLTPGTWLSCPCKRQRGVTALGLCDRLAAACSLPEAIGIRTIPGDMFGSEGLRHQYGPGLAGLRTEASRLSEAAGGLSDAGQSFPTTRCCCGARRRKLVPFGSLSQAPRDTATQHRPKNARGQKAPQSAAALLLTRLQQCCCEPFPMSCSPARQQVGCPGNVPQC